MVERELRSLVISRMPEGGYEVGTHGGQVMVESPLLAASTLDEALEFARKKLTTTTQHAATCERCGR